jgi:hypothetical protein
MSDTPGDVGEEKRPEHQNAALAAVNSIDVARAEEEFHALARQLTQRSLNNTDTVTVPDLHKSRSSVITRAASHPEKGVDIGKGVDIEKGADDVEPFDLREYLTSSNDAQQEAGIKAGRFSGTIKFTNSPCSTKYGSCSIQLDCYLISFKHVGVTWEDLEVKVAGGFDSKVSHYTRLNAGE